MTYDQIIDRLGGVTNGMAVCPAHDDRSPSLAVTEGDDGKTVLHCHAGCSVNDIVAALGITISDLFIRRNGDRRPQPVATYRYVDEDGTLLFEVVRDEAKKFHCRRPNPSSNGWIWKLGKTRRVLYNLPAVIAAVAAGQTVYVVEGEKDVDTLTTLGVVGTTNPHGAGKWDKVPDAADVLAGANVIIVADSDEPGRQHARDVARSLTGRAASISLMEAVVGCKDVTDHLRAGRKLEHLDLIATTEPGGVLPLETWLKHHDDADLKPPDDLAALLDDVVVFVRRFVVMTDHQADAIALFVAHTHAVDAFDVVAYMFITSAVRRCGKSLLEDILVDLCHVGRSTTDISPAAMYRMVEALRPTLVFDEVDNIFTNGRNTDPTNRDLIGLINAGYRRGRPAYRMGGPNMRTVEEFDPFGPKVLAGIGGCVPDTVEDRCIKIRLERKAKSAKVERFRLRVHAPQAQALGGLLAALAALADILREAWPDLPDILDDRAQDIWEPLLAIADAAGSDWPTRARVAALALNADRGDAAEPESVELLADIRRVFDSAKDDPDTKGDRMFSQTIIEKLNALEETPWSGWHRGEGFRTYDLARLLKDFGIKSKDIRIKEVVRKGYELASFTEAWKQYLPATCSATPATGATPLISPVADVADVADVVAGDGTEPSETRDEDVPVETLFDVPGDDVHGANYDARTDETVPF